jgi:hypothetical protein
MSCPHFEPREPLADSGGKFTMLPLGGAWSGTCRAIAGEEWRTSDSSQRAICNIGYARGRCPRFPAGDGPDAVRFCLAEAADIAITLLYAVERDHHPHAHGRLTIRAGAPAEGGLLECQARAYAESYWRRTGSSRGD